MSNSIVASASKRRRIQAVTRVGVLASSLLPSPLPPSVTPVVPPIHYRRTESVLSQHISPPDVSTATSLFPATDRPSPCDFTSPFAPRTVMPPSPSSEPHVPPPIPASSSVTPTSTDVKGCRSVRSDEITAHPGNILYAALVDAAVKVLLDSLPSLPSPFLEPTLPNKWGVLTDKQRRKLLCKRITDTISTQSPPGQFLNKTSTQVLSWRVLSDQDARKTVA